MQQFAGRVYGPVIAHGIAWWHGAEGNYWGHNAMIRTRAFAEPAGLPTLRGRKPFGGHILSHDFVEAALMRRGGWAIHMVPGLPGSYEESPPSLPDLAIRDRRWCQGNLQHIAVLPARGLHWVSRMHLLTGHRLLRHRAAVAAVHPRRHPDLAAVALHPARLLPERPALFPTWPVVDPERAKWVFIGTMGVLLAPKLLAYVAMLFDGTLRRGCGGALRASARAARDADRRAAGAGDDADPVARRVRHPARPRFGLERATAGRRPHPAGPVARLYAWHTAFGLALALSAFLVSPFLLAWMSPVVIGQALAIPLALLTGSAAVGLALRRAGLLRIPEEVQPPAVLARANQIARDIAAPPPSEAMRRLCDDGELRAAHLAMLPQGGRRSDNPALAMGLAKLDESATVAEAAAALTGREKAAVLGNANAVRGLTGMR